MLTVPSWRQILDCAHVADTSCIVMLIAFDLVLSGLVARSVVCADSAAGIDQRAVGEQREPATLRCEDHEPRLLHGANQARRIRFVLAKDPQRARAALPNAVGAEIKLQPDAPAKHVWADFAPRTAPLLAAAGGSESMVAGA